MRSRHELRRRSAPAWRSKTASRSVRLRLGVEPLEPRLFLDGSGILSGIVFDDLDRDGVQDAGESNLSQWTIELQPVGSTNVPARVLQNPMPDPSSQFGRFLATSENFVAVSAHYDDVAGPSQSGAVYIFDASSGQHLHTLTSPSPHKEDRFGRALAFMGDYVLVGAPMDDSVATDAGAVYMFDASSGLHVRTFVNEKGSAGDQFGRSLATVGGQILIGARFDDTPATDAGAAFLFDGQTGEQLRVLYSPNPSRGAQFGYTVAATDERHLLIGARFDETGADGKGAVYRLDSQTGNLLQSYNNPSQRSVANEQTGFARSVAAVGDQVVVAARWDDYGADAAGAAFLFGGATGELTRYRDPDGH